MSVGLIAILVACAWSMTSSLTLMFHFANSKNETWWEKFLMVTGGFCTVMLVMTFTVMLLIDNFGNK